MTDIPKLRAEALKKAEGVYEDEFPDAWNIEFNGLHKAITAYHAHIAQALSEEDGQKAFEEWFDPCNIGILGATDAMMRKMALAAWKAALHSCPYRAIIHNNENRG